MIMEFLIRGDIISSTLSWIVCKYYIFWFCFCFLVFNRWGHSLSIGINGTLRLDQFNTCWWEKWQSHVAINNVSKAKYYWSGTVLWCILPLWDKTVHTLVVSKSFINHSKSSKPLKSLYSLVESSLTHQGYMLQLSNVSIGVIHKRKDKYHVLLILLWSDKKGCFYK